MRDYGRFRGMHLNWTPEVERSPQPRKRPPGSGPEEQAWALLPRKSVLSLVETRLDRGSLPPQHDICSTAKPDYLRHSLQEAETAVPSLEPGSTCAVVRGRRGAAPWGTWTPQWIEVSWERWSGPTEGV
jgi:hypothetical protein